MPIGSLIRNWRAIIVVVALAVAGALYALHEYGDASSPERATLSLTRAIAAADLAGLQARCTPGAFETLATPFGEQRFHEVAAVFDEARQRGMPAWNSLRQTVWQLAYDRLVDISARADRLGRDSFEALAPERRLELIEDQTALRTYIIKSGAARLAPDDRNLFTELDASRGQITAALSLAAGWPRLPETDRKAVADPSALSETETPAKHNYLVATGLQRLPEERRRLVARLSPADLTNRRAFVAKEGPPRLEAFLKTHAVMAEAPPRCLYTEEEHDGSLFRGTVAECRIAARAAGNRRAQFSITLEKQGARWIVTDLSPSLTSVEWEVR